MLMEMDHVVDWLVVLVDVVGDKIPITVILESCDYHMIYTCLYIIGW